MRRRTSNRTYAEPLPVIIAYSPSVCDAIAKAIKDFAYYLIISVINWIEDIQDYCSREPLREVGCACPPP